MKLTTKIVAGVAALTLLTVAGNLQADEAPVTNTVTISFTAALQNETNDNNTITTVLAPVKHTATTATILGWLATDEQNEANYGSPAFPNGAKLVVISGNSPDFQVLDKHNNFLVDVSDILSITNSGYFGSDVSSGKTSDETSLSDPTSGDQTVETVIYDDSNATGNYKFAFTGVMVNTTTDSKPANGKYKESQTHSLSAGQGDGIYEGDAFTLTGGSLKASGSGEILAP